MCFSAQASFTAAAALSIIGIISIKKAENSKMKYFATAPMFFAIQQALEGIVWITLNKGDTTSVLSKIGVYGFLIIAGAFWPTAIPWSLYKLEKNRNRKHLLFYNFIIGSIIAIMCLLNLIINGMVPQNAHHHINYIYKSLPNYIVPYINIIEQTIRAFYCLVTIGSFFISTISGMWILGIIGIIAFIVAYTFYCLAFGSVWCFFAAIASLTTYYIVSEYKAS